MEESSKSLDMSPSLPKWFSDGALCTYVSSGVYMCVFLCDIVCVDVKWFGKGREWEGWEGLRVTMGGSERCSLLDILMPFYKDNVDIELRDYILL